MLLPVTASPGEPVYSALLGALVLGRAADFLSTWVATPTLELEANVRWHTILSRRSLPR